MKESYNSPDGVYRRAKARGMDLVTITDHDRVDGALTIADRRDVIVGCEVTGAFPDDGVRVHLGVLGTDLAQHHEIQRLRHDVRELLPYLKQERLFTTLNHVASRINGEITAPHIASLMPWVDGIEIINGSRLPSQNQTAACLADACRKVGVAGSDSHTRRGIGRTWVEAPSATTREEFMTELHAGRVRVGGRQGNYFTMASDMLRLATGFYVDRLATAGALTAELEASGVRARRPPWPAARRAAACCGTRPLHSGTAIQSRAAVRPRQTSRQHPLPEAA